MNNITEILLVFVIALSVYSSPVSQVAPSFYWVNPHTGETVARTSDAPESVTTATDEATFHWVNPHTGEVTERNPLSRVNVSDYLRVDTTWRTYAQGSAPLSTFNNQFFVGAYSSTNGSIQMRVVRNPHAQPLQFHATTRTVNQGAGFNFTVPRGQIFYVQARTTSGHTYVRFE